MRTKRRLFMSLFLFVVLQLSSTWKGISQVLTNSILNTHFINNSQDLLIFQSWLPKSDRDRHLLIIWFLLTLVIQSPRVKAFSGRSGTLARVFIMFMAQERILKRVKGMSLI